jgi:benzoate 4-monooxygenase
VARIAIKAVESRAQQTVKNDRKDLLHYLISARDRDTGKPMPQRELNAEALTMLIAGSDTTSNSLTHILDLLCRNPHVHRKLQKEIDEAFPDVPYDFVAEYEDVKDLEYLHGVINETLRYRTPVSFGLPRQVPKGGAIVAGQFFKEGTVLSCPTFTVHHHPKAFEDPDGFHPERWIGEGKNVLEKYFLAFSYGPRACVGYVSHFLTARSHRLPDADSTHAA